MSKKKKKLIAGRALRDRGARKAYVEATTSDEDFDDDTDDDDNEGDEVEVEMEAIGLIVKGDEEETHEEEQPVHRTRKITLKFNAEILQQINTESETPEMNGAKPNGDNEDVLAEVEDLEAEIQDLKEAAKLDGDDEDDEEDAPRRLTRRVTRQSSFSKQQDSTTSDRPVHGRKGLPRPKGSSEKQNGDHTIESGNRRPSIQERLRKMRRKSRDVKKDKKKPKVSESEFEDEGEDDPDDDLSIVSDDRNDDSQEEYSSVSRQRHSRKPPPSQSKPKRSRNVSDEDSIDNIDDLEAELREIGAEIPQRQRQLRPTEPKNYFIPPPPDKDDIFFPAPMSGKKRSGSGRGLGGFGGFGGDFSGMGLGNRFRGITGLGTAGGADDSSDSVS